MRFDIHLNGSLAFNHSLVLESIEVLVNFSKTVFESLHLTHPEQWHNCMLHNCMHISIQNRMEYFWHTKRK